MMAPVFSVIQSREANHQKHGIVRVSWPEGVKDGYTYMCASESTEV